jgi:hypothetical protein
MKGSRDTTQLEVILRLDREHRAYYPGDTLSGEFHLEGVSPATLQAAEVTILWYTEGKGNSDSGVHFCQRFLPDSRGFDWRWPQRFSTIVPRSPWSYEGLIVKIRWKVRLRLILGGQPEIVCEVPFRVGDLPPLAPV